MARTPIPNGPTHGDVSAASEANFIELYAREQSNIVYTGSSTISLNSPIVLADPSGGSITLTLPTALIASQKTVIVKRITNGQNAVTIAADGVETIDGFQPEFILGNINEHVALYSNGVEWFVLGRRTFAFASMESSGGTFNSTTSFVKFDQWTTNIFSTPGRMSADFANDQLVISTYSGAIQDGYDIVAILNYEGSNNRVSTAQLFFNGVAVGQPVSSLGNGAGKPATLLVNGTIGITAAGNFDVRVMSDTADTLTILSASIIARRIGG